MKASVTLQNLRAAIAAVGSSFARVTVHPAIQQVQVTADGDTLTFVATDLDAWAICKVPAEVHEPGVILLHGPTLVGLAGKIPVDVVSIAPDPKGDGVVVKSGKMSFRLAAMDPDRFPDRPSQDAVSSWAMPGSQLALIAARVPFAASKEESKGILQGVHLQIGDGRVEAAAASTAMLSVQAWPAAGAPATAVMTPAGLKEAARIFGTEASVEVVRYGAWIGFSAGRVAYLARLMSGAYPEYRRLVPAAAGVATAIVDREALLRAVELADVVSVDTTSKLRLEFDAEEVRVLAASDRGEGGDRVPLDYEGEPITLWASAEYLRPALRAIPTKQVRLEINGALRPLVLRPVFETSPPSGTEQVLIVMPMHADNAAAA